MFLLGKILEALGCADVGFALYYGIANEHGMGKEFQLAMVGVAVFAIGYMAERWSAR